MAHASPNPEGALQESDINDIFESIALSEANVTSIGFQEGFEKGKKEGGLEGLHLGYHKGSDLGAEIGQYVGAAESWLALGREGPLSENNSKRFSEKTVQLLQKIVEEGNAFPRDNTHEIDIINERDKIRSLYKRVCSILKCSDNTSSNKSLSF